MYSTQTRPRKSVGICEIFIKFVVSWALYPRHYIFDESVFAFILDKKSDSFKQRRGYDNTHFLYSYVAMHSLRASTPYYPSVGSCNRLFVLGFVRTSYQINGSQLHTFFLLFTHHRGAYGFEQRLTQTIVAYDTIRTERLPRPRNRGALHSCRARLRRQYRATSRIRRG